MNKNRIISSVVLLCCIFFSLISASVAWFASFTEARTDGEFSGSSMASYFAGGSGAADDPYIINQPHHLYNLSWLQNTGSFQDNILYFKVCNAVQTADGVEYRKTTIDMAASANAGTGKFGAIPPIGTYDEPFLGYFDGCGSTISNLWISTVKADWIEQPATAGNYESSHVGLFGAIGGTAIVEDFVLDRVEIKSHLSSAKIGIICGYVDAMLKNVGVYNGIMNVSAGSCTSDYSLIGEKSDRIHWDDMPVIDPEYSDTPGGEGGDDGQDGDLVIDPNQRLSGSVTMFPGVSDGSVTPVPGSKEGTAYFVGELETTNAKISQKKFVNLVDYYENGTYYSMTAVPDDASRAMKDIFTIYTNYQAKDKIITIGAPFDEYDQIPADDRYGTHYKYVTDRNGYQRKVPKGCIWFQPAGSGTVSLSFAATDSSNDRYAMLYVCQRQFDADGTPGELEVVAKHEFILPIANKIIGLGQIAYYEYEISAADAGKYEYIIGASNVSGHSSDFGFFALALAGVDANHGDNPGGGDDGTVERPTEDGVFAEIMYDVDYVVAKDTDIAADDYQNHRSLLRINSASAGSVIYYLAIGERNDSVVYYYYASGVSIIDIARSDPKESAKSDTKDSFSDRAQPPSG